MATTKSKGDFAQSIVMTDLLKRGYKVAIPYGEDWKYDLIALRNEKLERLQVKYTESNGEYIRVECRSSNNWQSIKYTSTDFDYLVVVDITTGLICYLPSDILVDGKRMLHVRITAPKASNGKDKRFATDFVDF